MEQPKIVSNVRRLLIGGVLAFLFLSTPLWAAYPSGMSGGPSISPDPASFP